MSATDPRLVFVLSPFQNAFFKELAEVLIDELLALGVQALAIDEPGAHVVQDDDVFVIMPPHEYIALEGSAWLDDAVVAARTIGISAEQPHQVFFEANGAHAAKLGALFDFSEYTVRAFQDRGVAARHLRFGYTQRWDRFDPAHLPSGDPTVLYLGNKRPRRLGILATAAESLNVHHGMLLVSDNITPNLTTTKTFRAGEDKRDLLQRTRLLVNIHQSDEPYFEWLRFCEAAHCGTPVLSEESERSAPFVAGEHFLTFGSGGLAQAIDAALGDEARLQQVRAAAYATLRDHPLRDGVQPLIECATELLSRPAPAALPARVRTEPSGGTRRDVRAFLSAPPQPVTAASSPQLVRLSADRGWRARRRQVPGGHLLIAPTGTVGIGDGIERLAAAVIGDGQPAATGVLAGHDAAGNPMLEGIWPWDTFRLLAGQHLGRLMVVRSDVGDAALRWAPPALRRYPHLAVQAWMAATGLEAVHLPVPLANSPRVPVDPTHELPPSLAALLRRVLGD